MRNTLRYTTIVLGVLLTTGVGIAAEKVPVEAFSRLPRIRDVQISPSGKYLAYLVNIDGDYYLTTQTIGEADDKLILRSDHEVKIRWFRWANDSWLLVSAQFANVRSGVKIMETRLVRIKRRGSQPETFFTSEYLSRHKSQFQDDVVSVLPDDEEHFLVALDAEEANFPSVYQVDVEKGSKRLVHGYRKPVREWMTDQQDRVRLGIGYSEGVVTTVTRRPGQKKWKELWRHTPVEEAGIHPMGFGSDPDELYVRALHEGRWAVFTVNLSDPALARTPVAHDVNYDIEGSLIRSPKTRDVVGVYHQGSEGSRMYWNEEYEKLQRGIDSALPDTTNLLIDLSRDERRYLVFAASDVDPGIFLVGNRDTGGLGAFGSLYPELADAPLSGKEPVTYEASDGLAIAGYLTRPWDDAAPPWPTIVLPHGGPGVRDYADFDYLSEFLASRGYAVLQMNFRGSSGYGWDFESAGFQDMGGRMQDDVSDGAKWMVESGLADADRMCILGGSYGGYAALWGAVKTPDLFRCAISINGVTDWPLILATSRRFVTAATTREQLGKREHLKKVSPLRRAADIRIPILLLHGEDDRVVEVAHGRKMAKALKKNKKVHTYIELENGSHSLNNQGNRTIALEAIEAFLAEYAH